MTKTLTESPDSTFALVPLAAIATSKTNPRKSFDQDKLNELASTIKATGVHTPILLRHLPPARLQDTFADRKKGEPLPEYEIVAGERRYRASVIADVATIPAVIRAMTDEQALRVQMIENLQRADLSELEEAEGYQQLCDLTNISKEALGAEIGRSRRYVYQRLALLKLQPLAKDALRLGKISYTAGLAISQVHDGALQAKAFAHAQITDGDGQQISTRQLQTWMRSNVLLALNKAPFDIKAPNLHTISGSCTACPKRTGADQDIFADNTGPDSCCDAPCYHAKAAEAKAQTLEKYERQGIPVIQSEAAQELQAYGDSDRFIGYSAVSQTRKDTTNGEIVTLLDLLGKKGQAAAGLVAIENPDTKQVQVYVDTFKAENWLEDQGLIVKAKANTAKAKTPTDSLESIIKVRDFKKLQLECNAIYAAVDQVIDDAKDKVLLQLLTPELIHAFAALNNDDNDELKTSASNVRIMLRAIAHQTAPGAYSNPEVREKEMAGAISILKVGGLDAAKILADAVGNDLDVYNQQIEALQAKTDKAKPNLKPTKKAAANTAQHALPGTTTFTPGQKVKVIATKELHLEKYIGAIGKIKKPVNGNWDVAFHGKGIAEFESTELVPA